MKLASILIAMLFAVGCETSGVDQDELHALVAQNELLSKQIAAMDQKLKAHEATSTKAADLLKYVQVDPENNTIIIKGANLQIINGLGTSYPGTNGLGNVILGYNEEREDEVLERSGSHNLVIGARHEYTAATGIVAGQENTISDIGSVVLSGQNNIAEEHSVILSGRLNRAKSTNALILGGEDNLNHAYASVILGGTGSRLYSGNNEVVSCSGNCTTSMP